MNSPRFWQNQRQVVKLADPQLFYCLFSLGYRHHRIKVTAVTLIFVTVTMAFALGAMHCSYTYIPIIVPL